MKKDTPKLPLRDTLSIYLQATLKHRRDANLSLLLPIGNVLFSVITPFYASHVLADMISHSHRLWPDFILFAGSSVIGLGMNLIGIRANMRLQADTMRDLNMLVFNHLLERSVGFFNNQIGGKLVSDVGDFIMSYGTLFGVGYLSAVPFAAGTLIGLVLVFASNWAVGLSVLALLTLLGYWTTVEAHTRSNMRNQRMVISKKMTAHLSDSIVNAVTVKTFANEQREIATNRDLAHQLADARTADWVRNTTTESYRMGVLLLMQIVLILLLIRLSSHSTHLLATGIFAFTFTLTLVNRYFSIGNMLRQIEESFMNAAPIVELLKEAPEITDASGAKPLVIEKGEISCDNVTFRYAETASDQNVFEKLNLHIAPGEKIGLVGHSGGGKSTLTRLLLRFDDITDGAISIDEQDIRRVTQVSLRKQISYVPQEPLLFHRSIRENIAYGNDSVSEKDIEQAADLAYANDFIKKLPKGYETMVGERGVKLSGGQRQRIAIARAILKNAPILVLDEATSALDSESEKAIQKALWKLMEGKTTVIIAHRLSTIQKMDRILVLDDGKIVEQGSHTQLLENNSIYAKLWAHQSGGFIEE